MAVTLTIAQLAAELGLDVNIAAQSNIATRLQAVAAAYVERYAPSAPDDVANEAVIRFAAYLNATRKTLGFMKTGLSGLEAEHFSEHGPMFRRCGAKALLKPWARRNLGVC